MTAIICHSVAAVPFAGASPGDAYRRSVRGIIQSDHQTAL
jgi:hypothetical protein